MNWLSRVLGRDDDHDPADESRKAKAASDAMAASDAAKARADRVIAAYRRFDDDARMAGRRSREAGERLIDEVEDEA